jgi:aspartate aminotransferase-like enzyme
MPSTLYLDAARMGQMAPSTQWALHDFVRLAGEEGCTLYLEHFLTSGFSALPFDHQQRYPGLRCWGGLDELKNVLADFAGLPMGSRPLIAGRSTNLMKLAAKLLFRAGSRVLVSDLTWPSYQRILEREARKSAGEINRVGLRHAILRGALSGAELVDMMVRSCRARNCSAVFIPEISHDGIRLPVADIVAALRHNNPASFIIVDGSQAFGHVPLKLMQTPCDFYLAGCHKWLGSYLPLGIGFLPNPPTRADIRRQATELVERCRLDDPILAFLQTIESGRMRRFTETVNLSPLFSCRGALEDQFTDGPIAGRFRRRLANAELVRRIAQMTAWKPLAPMAELRSATVLLRSTSAQIGRFAPDRLRSLFHERGISLTCYAGGLVRLAMPSVPLSTHQAGSLIQALALVQPHASWRAGRVAQPALP